MMQDIWATASTLTKPVTHSKSRLMEPRYVPHALILAVAGECTYKFHVLQLVHLLSRPALATSTHGMPGTDFARATQGTTTITATWTSQVGCMLVLYALSVSNAPDQYFCRLGKTR